MTKLRHIDFRLEEKYLSKENLIKVIKKLKELADKDQFPGLRITTTYFDVWIDKPGRKGRYFISILTRDKRLNLYLERNVTEEEIANFLSFLTTKTYPG